MEVDIELLHAIIDRFDLIIAHHPDSKSADSKSAESKQKGKRRTEEKRTVESEGIEGGKTYSFIKSISRRLLGEDMD